MSEKTIDRAHYPRTWEEFIGQLKAVEQLQIRCAAAKRRNAPLDPVLIVSKVAGVGKTALARLVAMTLGGRLFIQNEPIKPRSVPFLMDELKPGDVLFFDEFHKQFEGHGRNAEWLLTFLEDGKVPTEFGLEDAPPITVIGATTDIGKLGGDPFLTRFTIQPQFVPYTDDEAVRITAQLAERILVEKEGLAPPNDAACAAIARAASNNPREVGKILKALRDLVLAGRTSENGGAYDVSKAIEFAGLTPDGLTGRDLAYLKLLSGARGRPLGRQTLKAHLGEVGEGLPYLEERLVSRGLVSLTDGGQVLTSQGRQRAQEAA